MNNYEHIQFRLTDHAHEQYCDRVEKIGFETLAAQCLSQLQNSEYGYNKDKFIHLAGVWWVYEIQNEAIVFITCYGKTTAHIPNGLKWAIRHNDRIDLKSISQMAVMK